MARVGSNKSPVLQARVMELSATGMSGRKIADDLNINRRTAARILVGPEAWQVVTEARERARDLVVKADAALHKSLDRGSSRTAIAVLRGSGVFETRAEAIVRYRFRDAERAKEELEELQRRSRRQAERKFGRHLGHEPSREEWERENARLDRLSQIEHERAVSSKPEEIPFGSTSTRPTRGRRWRYRPRR